jgi:hypothetical protein
MASGTAVEENLCIRRRYLHYTEFPRVLQQCLGARIEGYYIKKAEADTGGFMEAIRIAVKKGSIKQEDKNDLMVRFYIKLGETLGRENENKLAREQLEKAAAISRLKTLEIIRQKGLQEKVWANI